MDETERALDFYKRYYEVLAGWHLQPGSRILLGQRKPRTCRFCGRTYPIASFKLEAHAIPALLGNKSIFSLYECDACNKFFGDTIENDLGNWSKPLRTLQRIRGRKGVPTLKSNKGHWRIECDNNMQFQITHERDDPVFTVFEDEKRIEFLLDRAPHIPIAVLKAFVKIGISLMPSEEVQNFSEALHWICNPIHREEIHIIAPVSRSFIPGPSVFDRISVALLRRRGDVASTNVPYCFLILTVANEQYQVMLPSPKLDPKPEAPSFSIPPFPAPRTRYGQAVRDSLDLRGLELLAEEKVSVSMVFEKVEAV